MLIAAVFTVLTFGMAALAESDSAEEVQDTALKKPERGADYEIAGDAGAWYRDESGCLWVRPGSGLSIQTESGTAISQDQALENLQKDGVLTFRLQKTDEAGEVRETSDVCQERYYIDGEAPAADIIVEGNRIDGVVYAPDTVDAEIAVAPDGRSGLKSAAYLILPCEEDGSFEERLQSDSWVPCGSSHSVQLSKEGSYRIFVRTEDRVGNLNFSESAVICIDKTEPVIKVKGIRDQEANAGKAKIRVKSSDAHFKPGSVKIEIAGINSGKSPAVSRKEESAEKSVVRFYDFPRQKSYDDTYRIHVKAEDLAGNIAEQSMVFSINRFGPVYSISDDMERETGQYYFAEPQPVTFFETNTEYAGESELYGRRDGELKKLQPGVDYFVTREGGGESWKRYCYTVPAEYFKKEGVYELVLSAGKDRKGQSSGSQEMRHSFVLDWTAPGCRIEGIAANQRYETGTVTARFIPSDNAELKSMEVYCDGELLAKTEQSGTQGEAFELPLEEPDGLKTFEAYVQDRAGNTYHTGKIPVYTGMAGENVPDVPEGDASVREIQDVSDGDIPAHDGLDASDDDVPARDAPDASNGDIPAREAPVSNERGGGRILLFSGLTVFLLTVFCTLRKSDG